MLTIGHRGAKGYLPENTLEAFALALKMGVDGIELDVHVCKSGEVIVLHDETLQRTTNGHGFVADHTLTELKALWIEEKYKIPTLREVLDLIDKRCLVNIELKGIGTCDPVIELLQEYLTQKGWHSSKFIVSSFCWGSLKSIKSQIPEVHVGIITQNNLEDAIKYGIKIEADAIHPNFELLNAKIVKALQKQGFQILTWTVNTPEDIKLVQSYQVDGIISDFPDRV